MLDKHNEWGIIQTSGLRPDKPFKRWTSAAIGGSTFKGFFMPEITVNGYKVLFDEADQKFVESQKWSIRHGWKKAPYVHCKLGLMHRIFLNCPKGLLVDHRNHNTLDNRKENLRIATRAQNMWNRKNTCGSSKYKGVYWHKSSKKWQCAAYLDNKGIFIGTYETEELAAKAYNIKALELYGEFACLNIIEGDTP